jgi:DNA modification methylase
LRLHFLDVGSIIVRDRFRKDLGVESKDVRSTLSGLRESIKNRGLLHPIVVDRDFKLIAGERRLVCCRDLGWKTIPCLFIDEVNDLIRREIELEENFYRKQLTWQEEALLIREIDRVKRELYGSQLPGAHGRGASVGGWTQSRTAEALGVSQPIVFRSIAVAHAMDIMPELANEESRPIAFKKIDRYIEDIERELERRKLETGEVKGIDDCLWEGDCCELLTKVQTASVDLIITDPPYGIDYDSVGGTGYRTPSEFDDTPEATLALLRSALKEMRRILKPTGHLYAFFGIQLWAETISIYKQAGFEPDPLPCVWIKNKHETVDWDKRYAPAWEPFLFCTSKERSLNRKRTNVFQYDVDSGKDMVHSSQKPIALLEELIDLSSMEGQLVLDPFCGSGSIPVAAKRMSRRFLGIEIDNRLLNIARLRLLKEQPT